MGDYGRKLEVGVVATPAGGDAAAGPDLVTFQDHPYQPRFLDALHELTAAARSRGRSDG